MNPPVYRSLPLHHHLGDFGLDWQEVVSCHAASGLRCSQGLQLQLLRFAYSSGTTYEEADFYIINNTLYSSPSRLATSRVFDRFLRFDPNKVFLAQIRSDIPSQVIDEPVLINLYSDCGDMAFHYGHFLRDCVGLMHWLAVSGQASEQLLSTRCIGPSRLTFQPKLASDFGLKFELFNVAPSMRNATAVDQHWRVALFSLPQAQLLVPTTKDFALQQLRQHLRSKQSQFPSTSNASQAFLGAKRLLSGALLSRRRLKSKTERWRNDIELTRSLIPLDGQTVCLITLVDPDNAMETLDRARVLAGFDFVIGSGSSALYPSLLINQWQPHIVVIPFEPLTDDTPLADFTVFANQVHLITASDQAAEIPESCSFWQASFSMQPLRFQQQLTRCLRASHLL